MGCGRRGGHNRRWRAISSNQANKGAQKAANANRDAQQQAIDAQTAARDQARNDLMPYANFGQQAIPQLQALNNGDYSGFLNSPDYKAAFSQGMDSLDHSAASRGGLFGGGHTRDSIRFGQGIASQYLGNYRNSLFGQLGGGQNAAAGLGGYSTGAAANIGNAYGNMGQSNAYAANQIGQNNAGFAAGTAGALNGLAQNYFAGRNQSSYNQPAAGGVTGGGTAQGNYDWASTSGFGNNYGWTG